MMMPILIATLFVTVGVALGAFVIIIAVCLIIERPIIKDKQRRYEEEWKRWLSKKKKGSYEVS